MGVSKKFFLGIKDNYSWKTLNGCFILIIAFEDRDLKTQIKACEERLENTDKDM